MRNISLIVLGSHAPLLLAACASPQFVGRPDLELVENTALPAPTIAEFEAARPAEVIGPGDEVEIDVFGLPEVSRTVRVDSNGRIALPLAGSVTATNMSADELTEILRTRLRERALRDPKVTVNIMETMNRLVTIDGAVREPQQFTVAGSTSLMRTIARGSGVTEFARENYVVVFRRVGEQEMAALYDLRAIRRGIYADPTIYANDVVVVGESRAKRVFSQLLNASGILMAPIVALLQR